MVLWDEKGRRRFARYLERSPRIVKVICAVPGILLALEVAFGALALLDNGGEALATGTADIRTCTRDPLTGGSCTGANWRARTAVRSTQSD